MSRVVSSLLALCLLLVSGPGWASLFCGCGDAPEPACCCCEEAAPTPPGPAIEGRMCDKVEVGKADPGPSAGAVEGATAAPPAVGVTPVLAPDLAPRLAPAAPARVPFRGGDPPFIRIRSLRC